MRADLSEIYKQTRPQSDARPGKHTTRRPTRDCRSRARRDSLSAPRAASVISVTARQPPPLPLAGYTEMLRRDTPVRSSYMAQRTASPLLYTFSLYVLVYTYIYTAERLTGDIYIYIYTCVCGNIHIYLYKYAGVLFERGERERGVDGFFLCELGSALSESLGELAV